MGGDELDCTGVEVAQRIPLPLGYGGAAWDDWDRTLSAPGYQEQINARYSKEYLGSDPARFPRMIYVNQPGEIAWLPLKEDSGIVLQEQPLHPNLCHAQSPFAMNRHW